MNIFHHLIIFGKVKGNGLLKIKRTIIFISMTKGSGAWLKYIAAFNLCLVKYQHRIFQKKTFVSLKSWTIYCLSTAWTLDCIHFVQISPRIGLILPAFTLYKNPQRKSEGIFHSLCSTLGWWKTNKNDKFLHNFGQKKK